jgi:hypothetical protein
VQTRQREFRIGFAPFKPPRPPELHCSQGHLGLTWGAEQVSGWVCSARTMGLLGSNNEEALNWPPMILA